MVDHVDREDGNDAIKYTFACTQYMSPAGTPSSKRRGTLYSYRGRAFCPSPLTTDVTRESHLLPTATLPARGPGAEQEKTQEGALGRWNSARI